MPSSSLRSGKRLCALRKAHEVARDEAAARAGLARSTVSEAESRENSMLRATGAAAAMSLRRPRVRVNIRASTTLEAR